MDIEKLDSAIGRYRLIMHKAYNLNNELEDDRFNFVIRELEYLEGTEGEESKKFRKRLKKVANNLRIAINRLERKNELPLSELESIKLETIEFKNTNDVIICLMKLTEYFLKKEY